MPLLDAPAEATALPAATNTPPEGSPRLGRAVAWTGVGALVVPLGGLVVQPVLAHALGADGRGQLAAAMAPAVLATSVATLGLPETLTYYVARDPRVQRAALAVAASVSLLLGLGCLVAVVLLSPVLSGRDPGLARLMALAMCASLPLLLVGVARGAAIGRQMYSLTAVESVTNAVSRLVAFTALAGLDQLTPRSAVIVTCATQAAAGLVYVRALSRRVEGRSPWTLRETTGRLLSYGTRMWFGAVASMLLARTAQVVMVPLSSTRDLGLYSVVVTVSDLPVLVAFAVAGAVSGVNSQQEDWSRIALSCRATLVVTAAGCAVLAASLPWWLVPVFGGDFRGALWPTVMALGAAVLAVPAYVVAAGLSSSGRPGARSLAYTAGFVVNAVGFVVLVPPLGVLGATTTSVVVAVVLSAAVLVPAVRASGLRPRAFLAPTATDARLVVAAASAAAGRVLRPLLRRLPGGREGDG